VREGGFLYERRFLYDRGSGGPTIWREEKMRFAGRVLLAGAVVLVAAGAAQAQDGRPLGDCAGAVGTWLTTNPGKEPSRSLFSLTADGLVLFADSGEGGGAGFAPFTGGHGAWRCAAADGGAVKLSATVLDFTLPTVDWPNQQMGRLDIAATVDTTKGGMSGTMTLYLAGLNEDPLADAKLVEDAAGDFTAVRIAAP
jgi:hypothetical protein